MTFDLLSCQPTIVESGSDAAEEPVDTLEESGLDSKPVLESKPASRDDKVKFRGETGDESAMGNVYCIPLSFSLLRDLIIVRCILRLAPSPWARHARGPRGVLLQPSLCP